MSSSVLEAPNRFSKTGKGEIEGTIHAFIKSREREKWKIYTENKTYSKLWFLLYIYSVTPHWKGGKREGKRCRPSQFRGLAGREKHEEKVGIKKKKKNKKTERAAIITTTLLLFNFVYPLSPTLIWWKSRMFFLVLFDL